MIIKFCFAKARLLDLTHLQNKDLSGGAVDVEHGLVRLVGVNSLPGEEVHNVVLPVLVTVVGLHLRFFERVLLQGRFAVESFTQITTQKVLS